MILGVSSGDATPHGLLHPTGEFAARFMIIAMLATPLRLLFQTQKWTAWLVRNRRYFGVAAFIYSLIHTVFYVMDSGTLQGMLDEFSQLGIWTGWIAFFIFIPLALTSNDAAVKALRQKWKLLHRWVYPAAVLALVHWIFVENNLGPALVHFVPLAALEVYRVWHQRFRKESG
jgi:sulfoxide reductase heme-binding subunit YedZ